jgi:hypothetical protein
MTIEHFIPKQFVFGTARNDFGICIECLARLTLTGSL